MFETSFVAWDVIAPALVPTSFCPLHVKLPSSHTTIALFNPETSILIQKLSFYSGNLNSETPGDSKNAFLRWGDVSGTFKAIMVTG